MQPPFSKPQTYRELSAQRYGDYSVELSPEDWSWLACAIDAEGTIGVARYKAELKSDRIAYRAYVIISNTNMLFLQHVRDMLGDNGVRIFAMSKPRSPKHKICLRLEVRSRAIEFVLEKLKPLLILKWKQAEFALAFQRSMMDHKINLPGDHELYERLYLECKALNRRGV